MKGDYAAVLDLGNTKVTALYATAESDDTVKVRAVAAVPCKGLYRSVVTDLEETARSVDAAVRRLQQLAGRDFDRFVVAINGGHLEGTNAQGFKPIVPRTRHITHQDVMEVIQHSRSLVFPPDREQIQALPREFRIDGQRGVQRPIGMSGAKLEVVTYLVTGQSTHIQNTERAIEMAGKKVDQMVLAPLASGIGVLTPEEMDLGTVLVDIGGGTTSIAVFVGGSIAYSASLPIGGGLVTSDLSKLLKTSPEEADRLKLESGSAIAKLVPERDSVEVNQIGQTMARPMQRRVLCEIIESRMRELAVMVRQHLEKSGMFATLPGGVVLTGGGASMPNTSVLFEENLKHLRVRYAEPVIGLKDAPTTGLATSVGLATFALRCYDELAPATGSPGWRDRVRSLWSLLGGK